MRERQGGADDHSRDGQPHHPVPGRWHAGRLALRRDRAWISQSDVHSRVTSLVDQLDGLAKGRDLKHDPRLSLRGDIQRIEERMREEAWQPQGLAVFSCSGQASMRRSRYPGPSTTGSW